jgi:hypothetical protein
VRKYFKVALLNEEQPNTGAQTVLSLDPNDFQPGQTFWMGYDSPRDVVEAWNNAVRALEYSSTMLGGAWFLQLFANQVGDTYPNILEAANNNPDASDYSATRQQKAFEEGKSTSKGFTIASVSEQQFLTIQYTTALVAQQWERARLIKQVLDDLIAKKITAAQAQVRYSKIQ